MLVIVLASALALWAIIWALRDRAVVLRQLIAAGVVEAVLLVQLVAALVLAFVTGSGGPGTGSYWLYTVALLALLPVAAVWAFAERTRWSSVVLVVACLSVVFMQWRAMTMWVG